MDIESRTLRSLEWDKVKDYLAGEAISFAGKKRCLELKPTSSTKLVELLLQETTEALSLLESRCLLLPATLPNLEETIKRIGASASLSAQELLDLKATQEAAHKARSSLSLLVRVHFPQLVSFIQKLRPSDTLIEAIDIAIEKTGEIKDTASTKLSLLRRELAKVENQIKEELTAIIHSSTLSKALQEHLYTQRNGRYVLPVNASMRQAIAGIVHDTSASGLTVYVEPTVVVELANKLRLKETEIEREIEQILLRLSKLAYDHFEDISSSFEALVELDFITARARLSQKYRGTCPEISCDSKLSLYSARHPLLILQNLQEAQSVVANDIILGGNEHTMLVTGPNTGGKTVLLKTAGLLSLMAASGLLLPVARGSKIVVFSIVYADIGDEQSLVQSLSTFSSHMTNIIEMVKQATPDSLLLLDEIGAGTDPREGAALARAILEYLNEIGSFTIATTHFGELKMLAYTEAGFVNASLEFDELSLSPTYKLRLGIPGSSKATTIARRLGLDKNVVDRAEELYKRDAQDIQSVIDKLEAKLQELDVLKEEAITAQTSARKLEESLNERLLELKNDSELIANKYANTIAEEFKVARELLRNMIAELQKDPSSKKAGITQKEINKLEEQIHWLQAEKEKRTLPVLSIGQKVKVLSLNQVGIVAGLPAKFNNQADDRIWVRCGPLNTTVPLSDLELLAKASDKEGTLRPKDKGVKKTTRAIFSDGHKVKTNAPQRNMDTSTSVFVRTMANTVDLRGQRVEEALTNLEKFLDASSLVQVSPVMIIHGHGTGRIKAAVREYLQSCHYIKAARPGELYEGGDGVTIAELA